MRNSSPIWGITSYYNPFRGVRRYANYRAFRRNLAIPLVTAEWSPEADFQLAEGDAEVLVQVSGGDLMWQKECLLNIALDNLPPEARYVAWLDCDIIFDDPDWPENTIALLSTHQLVQLFDEVHNLPICGTEEIDGNIARQHQPTRVRPGLLAQLQRGMPFYVEMHGAGGLVTASGNPGTAYAAHVDWLKQNRFYDAAIVGGGDRMFVAPLVDRLDECFRHRPVTPSHARHHLNWVSGLHGLLPVQFTFLTNKIYHLYHGELSHRNYPARPAILTEFNFDPAIHVEKTPQGVWQWSSEAGGLRARVYDYLRSRRDS